MINQMIVEIVVKRILSGGLNPKTGKVYVLNDITNSDYRLAVEDYILTNKG
ncbi:hypothetical protein [Metasolibacillus sp. FSL K6-0083]|uniref:hypothetical protein n=1 Tax=Metasolibacillus sp. FSL K6-0083 TaxID=2921416 RepID=UPI00315B3973